MAGKEDSVKAPQMAPPVPGEYSQEVEAKVIFIVGLVFWSAVVVIGYLVSFC
jgi:hypothetical protein